MIISWFEKRVRRNVDNLLAIVHGREKQIVAKTSHQLSLSGLDYLPEDVRLRVALLKDWRRQQARTKGIPPYRLLHNKTVLHLAMKNPQSSEELLHIPGIKAKKMEAFGFELLDLLKSGNAGNLAAQH